jgi:hypothetical protein
MEGIKNKKIETILDAWKYVLSWKILGGGYLRCFLVFTDDVLIEFETNLQTKTLPFKGGSYSNDLLSNIFWGTINTLLYEVFGYSDKLNKIYQNKSLEINDLENILRNNKVKYKLNPIVTYEKINQIKIKELGKVSFTRDDIEIVLEIFYNNKKLKYEAYISDRTLYINIKEKLMKLLENKVIIN